MNFRQLRYFLAVADNGSIAQAAKKIHISQPSISVQVRALEDELGAALFERNRDGVVLTPEGAELLLHARGVMAAMAAARASVQGIKSLAQGPVGVGIPGSLAGLFTAPLVERVVASYPAVQLRVVGGLSGHTRGWILDGRLDLALVYEDPGDPALQLDRLFSEQLYLLAPADSPLCRRRGARVLSLPMQRLAGVPLVLPGRGYTIRAVIERAAEEAKVSLTIRAEVDAIDQTIDVVARTGCCSILSLAALHGRTHAGLVHIPLTEPATVRHVSLAHARHRPLTIAAREVQQLFRGLIAEKLQEPWWAPAIAHSRV
jgi:LysR family nitrogen assimilation transcriptional regulator